MLANLSIKKFCLVPNPNHLFLKSLPCIACPFSAAAHGSLPLTLDLYQPLPTASPAPWVVYRNKQAPSPPPPPPLSLPHFLPNYASFPSHLLEKNNSHFLPYFSKEEE